MFDETNYRQLIQEVKTSAASRTLLEKRVQQLLSEVKDDIGGVHIEKKAAMKAIKMKFKANGLPVKVIDHSVPSVREVLTACSNAQFNMVATLTKGWFGRQIIEIYVFGWLI